MGQRRLFRPALLAEIEAGIELVGRQAEEWAKKERRLFYDFNTNKIFLGRKLKDGTWSLYSNEDGVKLRKKYPKFHGVKHRPRGPLQYIGCL